MVCWMGKRVKWNPNKEDQESNDLKIIPRLKSDRLACVAYATMGALRFGAQFVGVLFLPMSGKEHEGLSINDITFWLGSGGLSAGGQGRKLMVLKILEGLEPPPLYVSY